MLPTSLTKRLVNHACPQHVTEGYASDWTGEQLRQGAQRTGLSDNGVVYGYFGGTKQ